eukprot:7616842-Pyramimonas_sp.AAC.1
MTNSSVLRTLRMVPVSMNSKMQRIKWLQDVVRRPLRNLQLLGAMFGVSTWEEQEVRFVDREGFRIGPEFEWWKQFLED